MKVLRVAKTCSDQPADRALLNQQYPIRKSFFRSVARKVRGRSAIVSTEPTLGEVRTDFCTKVCESVVRVFVYVGLSMFVLSDDNMYDFE